MVSKLGIVSAFLALGLSACSDSGDSDEMQAVIDRALESAATQEVQPEQAVEQPLGPPGAGGPPPGAGGPPGALPAMGGPGVGGGPPGGGGPAPQEPATDITPNLIATYKTIGDLELQAHIFNAQGPSTENNRSEDKSASLVFLHGGALRRGSPTQGYEFAEQFTPLGVAVVAVQYRLLDTNAETLDQILADAKSAIRWLRQNSEDLGIDPDRIVLAGHSAGAYLTLTTGVVPAFDEASEDADVSSMPNALIPWSAIVTRNDDPENSIVPEGLQMADFSAASYLRAGLPPARFIHGDSDPIASPEIAMNFEEQYRAAGNEASFHMVEGADHFFRPPEHRAELMAVMADFLNELGYTNN